MDLNPEAVDQVITRIGGAIEQHAQTMAVIAATEAACNAQHVACQTTIAICSMIGKCETPGDLRELLETLREATKPKE